MEIKITTSAAIGASKGDLTPFEFEGRNIRLLDRDGEMWLVAVDVARELGYDHTPHLVRLLDDDERGVHIVDTPGGDQELAIISEPGLYRAIVQRRANKKHDASLTAKINRFQRWVFHDVLPSIRKTGGYGTRIDVRDPAQLSKIAIQLIEVNRELEQQVTEARAEIDAARPKTDFFDQFVNADGLYNPQNCGRALNCRPNLFVRWLKADYLFYQGTALVPRVRFIQMGIFEVKSEIVDDKARPRTFITAKGLEYFSSRVPDSIKMRAAA